MSPCKRFITAGDTHKQCVACLGAEHAAAAFNKEADCPYCERLPLRTLRSRKSLFVDGIFTSEPRGSGPAAAEAERRLHSWGSQFDLEQEMETGESLSPSTASRSSARSGRARSERRAASSRGAGSTLDHSSSEEEETVSVDEPPQSLQYEELLEVVTRAVDKLHIDWPAEQQTESRGSKLDERFLRARPPPPHRSLPFFPDLHTEVCRSWGRPYSSRLFIPASNYYGNVVGLDECGYRAMPKVEQTLASYLSPHVASSLKAPALPTKPLRTTSTLVGRGYLAAGQAGACLHTMSVLQAYQADLLKELDEREQVSSDDIAELRRTADLSLRATKETARAIGRSMAAMVAAERHLWLTLSDMKTKTGSAYWTPRSRLLACSATLLTRSSTGFRRRVSKRRRSGGSSLAALGLRGLGSSPRRVPAPHTGRLKRRALPLALPRGGARSSATRLGLQGRSRIWGPCLRLGGPRRRSPDTWGCRTSEGRPLWGRKELQCLSLPSALDAALSPTQGDWDTRHPWGGL